MSMLVRAAERIRQQPELRGDNIEVKIESNCIVVQGSSIPYVEKLIEIVKNLKFCPLVDPLSTLTRISFTVSPYRLPFSTSPLLASSSLTSCVNTVYHMMNALGVKSVNSYPVEYTEHFKANHEAILELIRGKSGEVVIFGFGNGDDIPLEALAKQFSKVILFDIDIQSMRKAVRELPLELQTKISIIQKDFTGLLSYVGKNISQISTENPAQFLKEYAVLLLQALVQRESFDTDTKYQLVISSMLTSQLSTELEIYLLYAAVNKYELLTETKFRTLSPAFSSLLRGVKQYVIGQHFKDLAGIISPTGTVYWADTISQMHIEQINENASATNSINYKTLKNVRLFSSKKLETYINSYFEINDTKEWMWMTLPPKNGEQGHFATVNAFRLQLKSTTPSITLPTLYPHVQSVSETCENLYQFMNRFSMNLAAELQKEYDSHFDKSQNAILGIAKNLSGKNILILGLGNGRDIPLKVLAENNRITACDIDLQAMTTCVNQLPDKLKDNVKLQKSDLTGCLAYISQNIDAIKSTSGEDFLKKAERILQKALVHRSPIEINEKYDLVISSMLTSQLGGSLHMYLIAAFGKNYDVDTYQTCLKQCPDFVKTEKKIADEMFSSHFELISNTLTENGLVYYADHKTMIADRLGSKPICEPRPTFRDDQLELAIKGKLTLIEGTKKEWLWRTQNSKGDVEGSVAFVEAYGLKKQTSTL